MKTRLKGQIKSDPESVIDMFISLTERLETLEGKRRKIAAIAQNRKVATKVRGVENPRPAA